MKFEKLSPANLLSHLDMQDFFTRLFARIKIPICFSKGYNQRMSIKFYSALVLGLESHEELMEFFTYEKIEKEEILNILNKNSIEGLKFNDLYEIKMSKNLEYTIDNIDYKFYFKSPKNKEVNCYNENPQNYFIERKNKKGKINKYFLKDYINKISSNNSIIDLSLKFDSNNSTIRHSEILESIFNLDKNTLELIKIVKLKNNYS